MAKGNYGVNVLGGGTGGGVSRADAYKTFTKSVSMAEFKSIPDKELYSYLKNLSAEPYVKGTADTIAQRMILALDLNDKPQVVSESEFDSIIKQNGTPEFYHTMGASDYGVEDGSDLISAVDVQKSTMYGEINVLSKGLYGEGTYFADNYSTSSMYAHTTSDSIDENAMIRATLSSDANPISLNKLEKLAKPAMKEFNKEYKNLNKKIEAAKKRWKFGDDRNEIYALIDEQQKLDNIRSAILTAVAVRHGHNVIITPVNDGGNFYSVINRNAVIISNNIQRAVPSMIAHSWKDGISFNEQHPPTHGVPKK